jgi:hypothetical protein
VTFVLSDRITRAYVVVLYAYRFKKHPSKEPGMGFKSMNLSPANNKDFIQTFIREQVIPGIAPASKG